MNKSVQPDKRLQLAAGRGRFQQADRGGAHGHDAPATPATGQNPVDGFLLHASPLGVHPMVRQRVGRNRPKRAGTDVQRQRAKFHALLHQPLKEGRGEVQPGGRRRHRSRHLGVHRLIVFPIGLDHLALADVGRQGHAPYPIQQREGVFGGQGPGDPRAVGLLRPQFEP